MNIKLKDREVVVNVKKKDSSWHLTIDNKSDISYYNLDDYHFRSFLLTALSDLRFAVENYCK